MTTLKSFAMVAALLAGGTSVALAQTSPSATGGAAGNQSAAAKQNCVGVRHGLVECHNAKHMAANGSSASDKAATQSSGMHGSDTVILSAAQRRALWNDLSKQATNQSSSGFEAQIGTFLPKSVKIEPIPGKAAANNPQLQPYDYAMVDHNLVIVDPTSNVIADVVKK
ncbi:MAG: DUF1236 domain-containing protein [Xanthobacteraceae bacterium]